jgi:hypothetical protein
VGKSKQLYSKEMAPPDGCILISGFHQQKQHERATNKGESLAKTRRLLFIKRIRTGINAIAKSAADTILNNKVTKHGDTRNRKKKKWRAD